MAGFTLRITPSFERDFARLPNRDQEKVLAALPILEATPTGPHPKIKKLKSKGVGVWRLEVWPHRVRYDVAGRDVVLYRVRHRKDIYRD